jgi:5-methylcytosine-specific restriction endonuclease McrA
MDWIDIKKDKAHVDKEKKKAALLRKTNWWQALLGKGICHYCKNKFLPEEITMDHVVPLSRGGRSVKGNIVACCKRCNSDKKYLTPVDMILKELEDTNTK